MTADFQTTCPGPCPPPCPPPVPEHRPGAGADQPARRALGIDAIRLPGGRAGRRVAVVQREVAAGAFCTLVEYARADAPPARSVVLVPPISGHFALILRDVVLGLVPRFRVWLIDWTNPRHVPVCEGTFGFDDNIAAVMTAVQVATPPCGPAPGVLALCQGGVPALAAVALMAEADPAACPARLALVGAPIDPAAAPTDLVRRLRATPLPWLGAFALSRVPAGFVGHGRRVYPARTQLGALTAYLRRRAGSGGEITRKLAEDDGADPDRFPFVDMLTAIMDIDAPHFLENIDRVFQTRALPAGRLRFRGRPVRPEAIGQTALLTVEGLEDDIAAPGQTEAAHALCPALPDRLRQRLLVPGCGHFGLFHGEPWRSAILPVAERFFRGDADGPAG